MRFLPLEYRRLTNLGFCANCMDPSEAINRRSRRIIVQIKFYFGLHHNLPKFNGISNSYISFCIYLPHHLPLLTHLNTFLLVQTCQYSKSEESFHFRADVNISALNQFPSLFPRDISPANGFPLSLPSRMDFFSSCPQSCLKIFKKTSQNNNHSTHFSLSEPRIIILVRIYNTWHLGASCWEFGLKK